MKNTTSIGSKLLSVLLIRLSILFVLTALIAYNLAAWFANDSYDKELLNAAHAVAARLTKDRENLVAELPSAVQEVLRHNDRDQFFYQVLNTNKERLAGDAILPIPEGDIDTERPSFRDSVVNSHKVRIARIRVPLHQAPSQLVVVQVARTLNARNELIHCIFLSIVIPQIILGFLSVYCVRCGIKDGLKPLTQLSEDVQRRSQSDLTAIDMRDRPSEMVPFIDAINSLFARLESHIDEQQRFVSNAAHQLRTPVAGLRAYIEYGRRIANGNKGFSDLLVQLDSGTDRIAEMVGGLLVLARTSERRSKQLDYIDLNDLASEVTAELFRQAANKKIELFFLPSSRPSLIFGDRGELHEMLSNVVSNAVMYSPEGGVVNVTVKAGPPPVVVIQDNGPGIPLKERQRVFERFYRVLGTRVNGTGLGLAIVREIAKSHNATVELLDPPGTKGTLVRITFPNVQTEKQAC